MFLALYVDVVAIAEVIAFVTASHVDKAVNGLAFIESMADVLLGLFLRNLSSDNQLDVKVLRVLYFLLFWHGAVCFARKDRHFLSEWPLFSALATIFIVLLRHESKQVTNAGALGID